MTRDQIERYERIARQMKADAGVDTRECIANAEKLLDKLTEKGAKRVPMSTVHYSDDWRAKLYEDQVRRFREYELEYLEHIGQHEAVVFERLIDAVAEAKDYKKPASIRTTKRVVFTDEQMAIAMRSLERQEREAVNGN